jgi:hypothetical protein
VPLAVEPEHELFEIDPQRASGRDGLVIQKGKLSGLGSCLDRFAKFTAFSATVARDLSVSKGSIFRLPSRRPFRLFFRPFQLLGYRTNGSPFSARHSGDGDPGTAADPARVGKPTALVVETFALLPEVGRSVGCLISVHSA